jgi:hypothetical protein
MQAAQVLPILRPWLTSALGAGSEDVARSGM